MKTGLEGEEVVEEEVGVEMINLTLPSKELDFAKKVEEVEDQHFAHLMKAI